MLCCVCTLVHLKQKKEKKRTRWDIMRHMPQIVSDAVMPQQSETKGRGQHTFKSGGAVCVDMASLDDHFLFEAMLKASVVFLASVFFSGIASQGLSMQMTRAAEDRKTMGSFAILL
jgi:hypothetical protein